MLPENSTNNVSDRCVAVGCLPASFEKDCIATSNCKRGNLWPCIGTRFINHGKNADRRLNFSQNQTVIQLGFFNHSSDGVRHICNLLDSSDNIPEFRLVQSEPFV